MPCVNLYTNGFSRSDLEILLSPNEREPWLAIHIALDVQLTAQAPRATEEDAGLGRSVDFADRLEDGIPVRAAEAGRRAQAGDGVDLGVGVVDHDVGCIIAFDFCGQIL